MKKCAVALAVIIAVLAMSVFIGGGNEAFAADGKLSTPEGITLVQSEGSFAVVWGQVLFNDGYAVEIDGLEQTVAKDVNRVNADSLSAGVVHKVRVKALAGDGAEDSDYSALTDIVISKKLAAPTGVSVENLVLGWTETENAVCYKVTVNGVVLTEDAAASGIDLSDVLYSTGDYVIQIKAIGDNALLFDSDYSVVYTYTHVKTLAVPQNLSVTMSGGKVTAAWDDVPYAAKYDVYVDGVTSETAESYLDLTAAVSAVGDHTVKVRALGTGNFSSSEYTAAAIYSTVTEISAPVLVQNGDIISWEKTTGVNGYSVLVENAGGQVYKNAEYTGNSLDMAAITNGKAAGEYSVSVQALKNGNYYASDISRVSYKKYITLAAPVLTLDGTTVKWNAVENAADYTVSVDGRIRDANAEGTIYDFSADVSEAKTYVISVIANGSGWYVSSDSAVIEYVFAGKLAKTDVIADGLTVSWNSVLGAATYVVTADGEIVATGVTSTCYDLTSVCTEAREYVIGVYAEATGNYAAADVSTVSVNGVAPLGGANGDTAETKTYLLSTSANLSDYIVFVDGVKSDTQFTTASDNLGMIELPATAKKLIIVPDADNITENTQYFTEMDLESATFDEETGRYTLNRDIRQAVPAEDYQAATEEGYAAIDIDGATVYYHVKSYGYYPVAA